MTMIEALEKLAELNNYDEILVQTSARELKAIDFAIDDIRSYADNEDEIFDLEVTEETIREFDENGYVKRRGPLYRVVRESNNASPIKNQRMAQQ
jgi:hypothetical protein